MNLTVIGTGYVGLVTGGCFAEMGNSVCCVDVDSAKIERLKAGEIPIYEPGLDNLVAGNVREGRLRFTTSLTEGMEDSSVYFIAVGTPPGEDGSADLQHVLAVAEAIGANLKRYAVIVDKSTVPVGTADKVRARVQEALEKRGVDIPFDVASNPEFLKEGAAVGDFMKPDRIIVGTDSERAWNVLRDLYAPFNRNFERTIHMGIRDAEMTKYAANAMLATKISFINEISNICDYLDVDVENVRRGIGADSRIGPAFIYPGCGYGGSCFPKDVRALIHMAEKCDFDPSLLRAVHGRNEAQKHVLSDKIRRHFGDDLSGRTIGVWGLSFKPQTDDMREAPSLVLLHQLVSSGARIKAYDPVAMPTAQEILPSDWFDSGHMQLVDHQYAAIEEVDALALVTEWKPFRHPDFGAMKRIMRQTVVFDGRNLYDPETLEKEGFTYFGIGR